MKKQNDVSQQICQTRAASPGAKFFFSNALKQWRYPFSSRCTECKFTKKNDIISHIEFQFLSRPQTIILTDFETSFFYILINLVVFGRGILQQSFLNIVRYIIFNRGLTVYSKQVLSVMFSRAQETFFIIHKKVKLFNRSEERNVKSKSMVENVFFKNSTSQFRQKNEQRNFFTYNCSLN